MILYKYYGFDAGISALRSGRLGFRKPVHFNDPFELTFLSNASGPDSNLAQFERQIDILKRSVVILSLTRTPLNPLMWAHYGEEHTGFVVGYEVGDEFLASRYYNLIPVDDGDVVYTYTKHPHLLSRELEERLREVFLLAQGLCLSPEERNRIESLIRKVFLTKHATWVYEEEVRVVKILQSAFELCEDYQRDPNRGFDSITREVTPNVACVTVDGLYIYRKPVRIREVYLGVRNPLILNVSTADEFTKMDSSISCKAKEEEWNISSLRIKPDSWELKAESTSASCLNIGAKDRGLMNSFSFTGKEAKFLSDTLSTLSLSEKDSLEFTNWNNTHHLKINGKFL